MSILTRVVYTTYNDEKLLTLIIQGDDIAFNQIINRFHKQLYQLCWHFLQDQGEAEDILQQSFLKVWQKPTDFNPNKGVKFSTWIYQIAKNACLDYIKKRKRLQFDDNIIELIDSIAENNNISSQQEQTFELNQKHKTLYQCIHTLPEQQKTILILHYFQYKNQSEIAKILEVSTRTIEGLMYRARKKIKIMLEEKGYENFQ